jgi:LPS export ABC transporter protein LptC
MVFFAFIFSGCCKAVKIVDECDSSGFEQIVEKLTVTQIDEGKLKMILEAESANVNENENIVSLKFPKIKFYDKGNYISTVCAESADINIKTYNVKSRGKCTLDTVNNEHLETTDLIYDAKKKLVYSSSKVKIIRRGETVYGESFESDVKLDKVVIRKQRIILD